MGTADKHRRAADSALVACCSGRLGTEDCPVVLRNDYGRESQPDAAEAGIICGGLRRRRGRPVRHALRGARSPARRARQLMGKTGHTGGYSSGSCTAGSCSSQTALPAGTSSRRCRWIPPAISPGRLAIRPIVGMCRTSPMAVRPAQGTPQVVHAVCANRWFRNRARAPSSTAWR